MVSVDANSHSAFATSERENDRVPRPAACDIVAPEAIAESALSKREERERMALRRYQKPEPKKHGKHWTIVVMEECLQDGKPKRRQRRIRLAPLDTGWRKVLRLRDEYVKPLNEGLYGLGFGHNIQEFRATNVHSERDAAIGQNNPSTLSGSAR